MCVRSRDLAVIQETIEDFATLRKRVAVSFIRYPFEAVDKRLESLVRWEMTIANVLGNSD